MKLKLLIVVMMLSVIGLINADEYATLLEKGQVATFDGWLIKPERVKELYALQLNYNTNLDIINIYERKIQVYEKDIKDADNIVQLERQKVDLLTKQNEKLKLQTTIIGFAVGGVSIVLVGCVVGIVVYAVVNNI